MLIRLLFLIGLLIAGPVLGVDEDFYIPYTDTYGYVYDPETGQYVKQEDPAPPAETVVQKSNHNATVDPQNQVNPLVTETLDASKSSIPAYTILISGVVIVLIALGYWSLQRKKTR